MEGSLGTGFLGVVVHKTEDDNALILCHYLNSDFKVGDPCRVDPYRWERGEKPRDWMKEAVTTQGLGPPVMPDSCEACPVVECHGQTKHGGSTCLMRLRCALRRSPLCLKRKGADKQ